MFPCKLAVSPGCAVSGIDARHVTVIPVTGPRRAPCLHIDSRTVFNGHVSAKRSYGLGVLALLAICIRTRRRHVDRGPVDGDVATGNTVTRGRDYIGLARRIECAVARDGKVAA